jgi:hypothetical protein
MPITDRILIGLLIVSRNIAGQFEATILEQILSVDVNGHAPVSKQEQRASRWV